jgi:hypothetical protein
MMMRPASGMPFRQRMMLSLGWLFIVLMGAMMLGFSGYVAYVLFGSVF